MGKICEVDTPRSRLGRGSEGIREEGKGGREGYRLE